MRAFAVAVLTAVTGIIVGATGSSSSSGGSESLLLSQYAAAPQLWTQPLPTAVGNNVAASTRVYESVVNATHTLQVLSTVDGNVTTLLTSTNPTTPATIYGTGTLTSFAQNPGQVLTAGPGTTPTSVVIATTRAVFMFDTSFNFDGKSNPCIFQPDGSILAVAWAPTTGLYLVVQSTMLIWWNASTDMIAAPINVTTPLVGPATALCGMDGVCWIGDSVATFVVVYTNSAVIQTMPMRGQWPTDPAMAPVIKPVGGRRAVMAWGVRVGLLTSQQAGNLGMDWKATQTSNTTALGVFPMLGQRGLVVTGHNVSVTVYDLADGSTIGTSGRMLPSQNFNSAWTTIEVDTSAQPYLLLASGVNCAASWALINATGALSSTSPAWSANDIIYSTYTSVRNFQAQSSSGAPLWLLEYSSSPSWYTALAVSPRERSVKYSLQNPLSGGSFVAAMYGSAHTIATIAGPNELFGIDVGAAPVLTSVPGTVLASAFDSVSGATYLLTWYEAALHAVYKVTLDSSSPTLVTAWNAVNTSSRPGSESATLNLVHDGARLVATASFESTTGFFTVGYGAVIDVVNNKLLFEQKYPGGVTGAFADTFNGNLVMVTSSAYTVVDATTGTATPYQLSFNTSGFTFLSQWKDRVMLTALTTDGGAFGYIVISGRTGALLMGQYIMASASFTQDGGVVECVTDGVSDVNQYAANFTLIRGAHGVPCTGAPVQTPDGSVYFAATVSWNGGFRVYLARANFDQVALTPAVLLRSGNQPVLPRMIYNAEHQLMIFWDVFSGTQWCIDLIRGVPLWTTGNTSAGVTYRQVDASQAAVPGAKNLLWTASPNGGFTKAAMNLFTGDVMESVYSIGGHTYMTSNSVGRPVMIVAASEGTSTWSNWAVEDVPTPPGFRPSKLPLFNVSDATVLPLVRPPPPWWPPITVPPAPGSTNTSYLIGGGVGAAICVFGGCMSCFLRSRRRRAANNDAGMYHVISAQPSRTSESVAQVAV